MKLIELVMVKKALGALCSKNFSNFKTARALSKLNKKIDEEIKFFSEEEKKIIELYGKKDANGNVDISKDGKFAIEGPENIESYTNDINNLRSVEIAIDKIDISEKDFRSSEDFPTPDEMYSLECIINWVD